MKIILDDKYLIIGEISSIQMLKSKGWDDKFYELDKKNKPTIKLLLDSEEIKDPELPDDATLILEKERKAREKEAESFSKEKLTLRKENLFLSSKGKLKAQGFTESQIQNAVDNLASWQVNYESLLKSLLS